jgi:hypothetical protein
VFWRWLAALAIIANIALNYYANVHPFNGQTMGQVSAKYPTPFTPLAYAFGIWGLIFLTLTAYAVWQLLPAQRHLHLPDAVARPLLVANMATAAWVVLFAYEMIPASVLTMVVILLALVRGYSRVRRAVLIAAVPAWVSIPFALFMGWITVAAVINFTIGLATAGVQVPGNLLPLVVYLLLAVVIGLGLAIAWGFSERVFPLVVAWALVGIWAARLHESPALGWTAMGAAVVVTLLGLVLAQQRRKMQPWEIAAAEAAAWHQ